MSEARSDGKRIGVVGCKHTTRDFVAGLRRHRFSVDHVVTITAGEAERAHVAGYYDLGPYLSSREIPFSLVHQYGLNNERDQESLLALQLDLLLVIGWQRLIPAWWLESLSIGAFGMHGSSKPLPHGRGRSPMNWSLIQNKSLFFTHLFRYSPGVDDGEVVGRQVFDITPFDDCHTLHFKNLLSMIRLCADNLPRLLAATTEFIPQSADGVSYYPKRTEEDGLIYWDDSTLEIYNLIRAVTRPFPGAFSFLDDQTSQKIRIWRAIPFDTHLVWPDAKSGEVVAVFYDGSAVVKTGDTTLLIQECEGHRFVEADIGRRFGQLGQVRKMWKDLPL